MRLLAKRDRSREENKMFVTRAFSSPGVRIAPRPALYRATNCPLLSADRTWNFWTPCIQSPRKSLYIDIGIAAIYGQSRFSDGRWLITVSNLWLILSFDNCLNYQLFSRGRDASRWQLRLWLAPSKQEAWRNYGKIKISRSAHNLPLICAIAYVFGLLHRDIFNVDYFLL